MAGFFSFFFFLRLQQVLPGVKKVSHTKIYVFKTLKLCINIYERILCVCPFPFCLDFMAIVLNSYISKCVVGG